MSSNFKEKLLLIRLRKKDPDSFAALYDLYVDSIYRFVLFKLPSKQDAEDITSETFLKVWQYVISGDREIKSIRPLLYTTARNSVIDFYRRRAHAHMVDDEEVMYKIEDERQQNILTQIDSKAEVHDIESVMKHLKDEYREVVTLKYIEELSTAEIAEVLGKSKGSVRVLLHRALKVIKDTIEEKRNS